MLSLPILILLATFGHFVSAAGLDYDIQGSMYVVDSEGDLLVKFSPGGDSLRAVSGRGDGQLEFDAPVAVFARGVDLYVADRNNHRIQRFTRNLDYVSTIRTRDDPDERKRFGYPLDVAVTRQGDVVIVDGENKRIVKVNAFNQFERAFGDVNAGEGRLMNPSQVEVDASDNVYALDEGRLLVFDPFGSYVRDVPELLSGAIRAFSIDGDTLVAADSSMVVLYDLGRSAVIGYYSLRMPVASIRLIAGRLVGVEGARVAISSIPPSGESTEPSGP